MKTYSFAVDGAGITQLAECQLPKLNVAGSIPVTRSIFLLFVIIIASTLRAQTPVQQPDFWWEASGARLEADSFSVSTLSERYLKSQLSNGNRSALVPLIRLLVTGGRISEAEVWMEGRGRMVPVTRRDMGIALSWYGRYELYSVLSSELNVPQDLQDDDYGKTLAAIVAMGWMNCTASGLFMPDILVGPSDLELLEGLFLPDPVNWERDWIGMASLDSLFAEGIRQGVTR